MPMNDNELNLAQKNTLLSWGEEVSDNDLKINQQINPWH